MIAAVIIVALISIGYLLLDGSYRVWKEEKERADAAEKERDGWHNQADSWRAYSGEQTSLLTVAKEESKMLRGDMEELTAELAKSESDHDAAKARIAELESAAQHGDRMAVEAERERIRQRWEEILDGGE